MPAVKGMKPNAFTLHKTPSGANGLPRLPEAIVSLLLPLPWKGDSWA